MHRTQSLVLAAALMFGAGSAGAQTPRPTPPSPTTPMPTPSPTTPMPTTTSPEPRGAAAGSMSADTEFAQKAAMGGQQEVAGAKFAAGKASNAGVKTLANKIATDHTAANKELMAAMKTKHMAAGAGMKSEPEPWRTQTGAAFDRAYLDHVIEHHEKAIAMFEMESTGGTDADLKTWAMGKLPTLREHLKMAQDLKMKLGPSSNQ